MQQEKILAFNNINDIIRVNTQLKIPEFCNSIIFVNIGTTIVTINQTLPLYPGTPGTNNGDSFTFGGNRLEIFKGRLDISFTTGAGILAVFYKIYLSENNLQLP